MLIQSKNTTVTLDADLLPYQQAVDAAGGSISRQDLARYNRFVKAAKRGGYWSAVKWFNMFRCEGGVPALMVNVKHPADAPLTATGFVNGDYDPLIGLIPAANGSKHIATGIIPDTAGMAYNNIHASVVVPTDVGLDNLSGFLLADGRETPNDCKFIVSGLTRVSDRGTDMARGKSIRGISATTNNAFGYMWGSPIGQDYPVAAQAMDTEITLFRAKRFGTWYPTAAPCGGAIMTTYLTPAQMRALHNDLWALSVSFGRLEYRQAKLLGFGDSITAGQVATTDADPDNAFLRQVANALNAQEINLGSPSSTLRGTGSNYLSGYGRRADVLEYINPANAADTWIVNAYGVNDMNGDVAADGDDAIVADYQAKLTTIVAEQKAAGVPATQICVVSVGLVNNGTSLTKSVKYELAAEAVATAQGVRFVNARAVMAANGGVANLGDTVHWNNTGHALIAAAISTQFGV